MAWNVELSETARRQIAKLDKPSAQRILNFLSHRVRRLDNPRSLGKALQGSQLGEFWRYRIGPYRLICKIDDDRLIVIVLRIGHRREVYR